MKPIFRGDCVPSLPPARAVFWRRHGRGIVTVLVLAWSWGLALAQEINPDDISRIRDRYLANRIPCRDMSGRVNEIRITPVGEGWDGYDPTEWYFAADLAFAAGCGSSDMSRLRQALDFAESATVENWWEREIGLPQAIADGLLRGGSALPADLRGRLERALRGYMQAQRLGEWNGANTVWRAWARLAAGLYFEDQQLLTEAVELFRTATSQGDYAHIQHDWTYFFHFDVMNMHYGSIHYELFADYLELTEGTSFALDRYSHPKDANRNGIEILGEWARHWLRWITYQGVIDPFTITKFPHKWHYGRMHKGSQTLLRTNYGELAPFRNDLQRIVTNSAEPIGARSFPTGRYLTVRRPGFFASLAMMNLVSPHMEASPVAPIFGAVNLLTPRTIDRVEGDGVLNHPYRLLNLMTVPERYFSDVSNPGSEHSNRAHLGEITDIAKQWGYYGVSTLAGYYGIAGEYLRNSSQTFSFKKSWFFFDDEVVTTISDLSGSGLGRIQTWLNTFKVRSSTFTTSNGTVAIPASRGERENVGSVKWVFHDDMGYVFPHSEPVLAEGVTSGYARLYLDHGMDARGEDVVVILVPNRSQADVDRYARSNQVEIMKLDRQAHVVRDRSSGVVGGAFFQPAQSSVLSSNLPGYILYRADNSEFRLSLHNPHQERANPVRLEHEGDPVNPMVDFHIPPEQATYQDYVLSVPFRLQPGSDPSLAALELIPTGNGTEIRVRLRVYRKLELIGEPNGDGSYTVTAASIALSDAAVPENVIPPGQEPQDVPPVALPGGPYLGRVGEEIRFDGGNSYDPDGGGIEAFAWQFGDGNSGAGPDPVHAYNSPGEYTVTLRVRDDEGNWSEATTGVTVSTSSNPSTGQMKITVSADNIYELYVNGTLLGTDDNWRNAEVYTVPPAEGENVIAIKATNAGDAAGLVALIEIGDRSVVTDTNWKASPTGTSGWQQLGFDDGSWGAARAVGPYGSTQPWVGLGNVSNLEAVTGMMWIWSDDSGQSPVYFRYTIGTDGDGEAPDPPTGLRVRQ